MTRNTTSILLGASAPRVLTVPAVTAVIAGSKSLPARATVFAWLRRNKESGFLRPISRGLFLNQLAQPTPVAAEAAPYLRAGAIVSLQTVLGEAGVTNNYADVVTSVMPIHNGVAPSSRPAVTPVGEFHFHAMPARFLDHRAGALEDQLDLDAPYSRATPEKALLDWIYLGRSTKTRMQGPPLDIDLVKLNRRRLLRLAKAMALEAPLAEYLARKKTFDAEEDGRLNPPDSHQRPRVAPS